uniref:Mitochondrial FtsZ1 n=1 Tax=Pharyngomonas kirbyi TaxID=63601 RepID=A0A0E3SUA2_9EUKA|nr:mitochondrial FtsZ1 [Pharyngomonas kirbyi]|eukprot:gb/GECH01014634.1/.p1 GENE.gb/GECH01014634.1/~~gb/GECH01014634.1/.p1  ORF type:complete len:441 (+),score=89.61 gb/GECH01014634.1/:1-1323(+)
MRLSIKTNTTPILTNKNGSISCLSSTHTLSRSHHRNRGELIHRCIQTPCRSITTLTTGHGSVITRMLDHSSYYNYNSYVLKQDRLNWIRSIYRFVSSNKKHSNSKTKNTSSKKNSKGNKTIHNTDTDEYLRSLQPRITVIGVGGGGSNAVDNMIKGGITGVNFAVANTDAQALRRSKAPIKIQLGAKLTKGLGAGSKPETGRKAAEESINEVLSVTNNSHMVFVTAGLGGGTGTGAVPVIAQRVKERGILTVGVVTRPFMFEGNTRNRMAQNGLDVLSKHVDTTLVIPNQNLLSVANKNTSFLEAFKMADDVLFKAIQSVTDPMLKPGLINLDFADVQSVMTRMGRAVMGVGEADGENRGERAAASAVNNPLLERTSLDGAQGILVNVTGGADMKLSEVQAAADYVSETADNDAQIIFGASKDEKMSGRLRVAVVATGLQ